MREPLTASAYLCYLPCVQPQARLSFLHRAMREGGALPSEWARLRAAAALQLAALGRGHECAAQLGWLEAEGVDLRRRSGRKMAVCPA